LSAVAKKSTPERRDPMDARRYALLPDPFPMWRGGELHGAQIAYETWGELNAARDNAILLFTGLSPSAHAASSNADPSDGWWQRMVGPGLAIDTDPFFVVCVNSLGSCFGSAGPSSNDPATGKPYRLSFPDLSVEDIARAGYETVRSLGIERLDTVIGPSLGGMVVLAYAAQFPGASRRLISVSGTPAAAPFAIALRSIQREAITTDPDWRNGNYTADRPPRNGQRLARKLGTVTYRSAAEWQQRFDREPIRPDMKRDDPFASEFAVQGYLEAQAARFVTAFDANCYLYLSRAMDRFDLSVHGNHEAVLARSKVEQALVIGVETDLLFAISEQRSMAKSMEAAGITTRFTPLKCIEGHDSFLIDIERFGREIRAFLNHSSESVGAPVKG
jgi:homoserine O-acetyltransferase/O-succinyltransferase